MKDERRDHRAVLFRPSSFIVPVDLAADLGRALAQCDCAADWSAERAAESRRLEGRR